MTRKLKEFSYNKDGQLSKRKILQFNETTDAVEGIDLDHLSAADAKAVTALVETFEANLAPYVTQAWRKFLKAKIQ